MRNRRTPIEPASGSWQTNIFFEISLRKTSSSSSNYQKSSRENSSCKVTKKPIIYNAYIEIAKYISDGINNKSLTDLSNAITLLDKVNDRMILFATSKTKDLEKSLQVASTPEEKLNLFLQQ